MLKTSVSLKLIVIPCVVCATWMVTTSIMGKQIKSKAAPKASEGKVAVAQIPDHVASGPEGFSRHLVSLTTLEGFDVGYDGNSVNVHASVSMMSAHATPFHLWRLHVTDLAGDAVVSDVPYAHQAFRFEKPGTMTPAFDERLHLPIGEYRIWLSLYKASDGVKAADILADAKSAMISKQISISKTIKVF